MARKPRKKDESPPSAPPAGTDAEGQLSFDFIKSNFFRTIHVDGAFGGIGPTARTINMAIYSERRPIPTQVTHLVAGGELGAEVAGLRKERISYVRELEANLVFDLPTALAIQKWLRERIEQLVGFMKQRGEIAEGFEYDGKS
jgi:hypothetical protein